MIDCVHFYHQIENGLPHYFPKLFLLRHGNFLFILGDTDHLI